MVVGTNDGGCGGSCCRQTPAASAVELNVLPLKVVLMTVLGLANPQTTAAAGCRCSTMSLPRLLLSSKALPMGSGGGLQGGHDACGIGLAHWSGAGSDGQNVTPFSLQGCGLLLHGGDADAAAAAAASGSRSRCTVRARALDGSTTSAIEPSFGAGRAPYTLPPNGVKAAASAATVAVRCRTTTASVSNSAPKPIGPFGSKRSSVGESACTRTFPTIADASGRSWAAPAPQSAASALGLRAGRPQTAPSRCFGSSASRLRDAVSPPSRRRKPARRRIDAHLRTCWRPASWCVRADPCGVCTGYLGTRSSAARAAT